MATLTESSNVGEAKSFLLSHMDSVEASDGISEEPRSIVNPSFTKEQVWNVMFGAVFQKEDSDSIHYLALRNMIKEFGSYYSEEAI